MSPSSEKKRNSDYSIASMQVAKTATNYNYICNPILEEDSIISKQFFSSWSQLSTGELRMQLLKHNQSMYLEIVYSMCIHGYGGVALSRMQLTIWWYTADSKYPVQPVTTAHIRDHH